MMNIESETKDIVYGLPNVEVVELKHAYRVNGVVDIYKYSPVVYDIASNQYHKNIFDFFKRKELVKSLVDTYPKRDSYKKTEKGRISLKEFKNNSRNEKQSFSDLYAEDYHWNNKINEVSEGNHLYFLIHGDQIKIGRSKNPDKRILSMKTGLGQNFECMIFLNKGFMEKQMHICFSEFRENGEWFKYHWRLIRFLKKYHNNVDVIKRMKATAGCKSLR